MNDEYTVFDNIRIIAQNELGQIEDEINVLKIKMDEYRNEQKRLRAVIKATKNEPTNDTTPKTKPKYAGIREDTHKKVVEAILEVTENGTMDFTVGALQEKIGENLTPSTVNRAVNFLRDSGIVRRVGKQGQAPIYRIGQMGTGE